MIALGVSAARQQRSDILVGGILGSFAYNLLLTLGLAASIRSLPVDPQVTFVALPVMVGVHLVLLALVWSGKIPRVMGGLLVLASLLHWSRPLSPQLTRPVQEGTDSLGRGEPISLNRLCCLLSLALSPVGSGC